MLLGSMCIGGPSARHPAKDQFVGRLRVSSLLTGMFAGPVGSVIGQHPFREALVVREAQRNVALYTPQYGLFELRARALADPASMITVARTSWESDEESAERQCREEIGGWCG